MPSGATSGAVSGASQGAVTGMQFGGVYGAIAGGVIGGVAGFISGSSADDQFDNQLAWAEYNRQSQYNTDIYNINSSLTIAGMNAAMSMGIARYNAGSILNAATYNANIIASTTAYNEELLDNELVRLWQDLDLDITQIEMFRARERGDILSQQSASGTIMNQDSNAETVIGQMTQEAMDVNIVQFGADRQAANISNQIAQGRWQGEVAIQQTMWEGQQQANSVMFNSQAQAAGSVMGATISANANMYTAKQAFMTAGYNSDQAIDQNANQNTQNMISGLFTAAASYGAGVYANKAISPTVANTSGSLATRNTSSVWGGSVNLGRSAPARTTSVNRSLATPGTSITLGLN